MKGATIARIDLIFVPDISIHAPVKGATKEESTSKLLYIISIHAPVKGATGAI